MLAWATSPQKPWLWKISKSQKTQLQKILPNFSVHWFHQKPKSFTSHLFIQRTFTEHLLYARLWAQYLEYRGDQNSQGPSPHDGTQQEIITNRDKGFERSKWGAEMNKVVLICCFLCFFCLPP